VVDGEGDCEGGMLLLLLRAGASDVPSSVGEAVMGAVSSGGGGGGGGCGVIVRGARRARRGSVAMVRSRERGSRGENGWSMARGRADCSAMVCSYF
jgi:hypothetical protein